MPPKDSFPKWALPRFGGPLRAVATSPEVADSLWKELSLGDQRWGSPRGLFWIVRIPGHSDHRFCMDASRMARPDVGVTGQADCGFVSGLFMQTNVPAGPDGIR